MLIIGKPRGTVTGTAISKDSGDVICQIRTLGVWIGLILIFGISLTMIEPVAKLLFP
tara:strand:+ start:467 stop:637 length:171 start_codon:yes stop_codon:yes gene_type:complete